MASVNDLTHESGFIFEAQMQQLGASTTAAYPAAPETAIVLVKRIIKSTSALAGYVDQRITVHLPAPVSLKVGDDAIFFTHGIHYSDGLVVTAFGATPVGAPNMAADLSSAVQASDDLAMTQRLAQADLVVSGVASAPRRHVRVQTATPTPLGRVSEHDPDWWTSTITVESVEKGTHAGATTDVLFANSEDVVWYHAPKVKEGDRGVWLLHGSDVYGKPVPAQAITHPLDFRPAEEVGRVRSLLK